MAVALGLGGYAVRSGRQWWLPIAPCSCSSAYPRSAQFDSRSRQWPLRPISGEQRKRRTKMTGTGDEDDVEKPQTLIAYLSFPTWPWFGILRNEKCAVMEGGRSQPGQDMTDPKASIDDTPTPTSRRRRRTTCLSRSRTGMTTRWRFLGDCTVRIFKILQILNETCPQSHIVPPGWEADPAWIPWPGPEKQ